MVLAYLGSVIWSLEGAPGGQTWTVLTLLALTGALGWVERQTFSEVAVAPLLANSFSSAALLGAAMTAMLLGHSYLIAPTMSITPHTPADLNSSGAPSAPKCV